MIRFTHPKAPQGNQTFRGAVDHLLKCAPDVVYAVDAMEAAGDLLVWIASRHPDVMRDAATYMHFGAPHVLALAALEEAEAQKSAQDTQPAKGE